MGEIEIARSRQFEKDFEEGNYKSDLDVTRGMTNCNQECSNWCWATSATMAASAFGGSQCNSEEAKVRARVPHLLLWQLQYKMQPGRHNIRDCRWHQVSFWPLLLNWWSPFATKARQCVAAWPCRHRCAVELGWRSCHYYQRWFWWKLQRP